MNWSGPRFSFAAIVDGAEASVGRAVLLPADDPLYGFVHAATSELSLTTFEPFLAGVRSARISMRSSSGITGATDREPPLLGPLMPLVLL
ncbi:hypothetical protein ASG83_08530 [Yonghaparkia sp. Soil809]|nr:hypothetical protein ASG83_08530 [Yonghaparkia sp. Soil809]